MSDREDSGRELPVVADPAGDEEPTVNLDREGSPDPSISGAPEEKSPESVPEESDLDRAESAHSAPSEESAQSAPSEESKRIRRPAPAGTLIWVLLALLGFTLVVQLRSNDGDHGLASARQEDLVRILSDLEAQDARLLADIQNLEATRQQLSSGVQGREAALAEATRRSEELGLLAGTVPGRGPGLEILLDRVKASAVLNAVQELRGARGEVMQLNGSNGAAVRVVASSYFVDASGGGIIADGVHLTGPFRLLVIGQPETMRTALQIPGGVVASVQKDGGSVTMDSRSLVEVTAVRKAAALQYARPVS
ncbi:DUF881 domain-containing protein [Actinoplanes aureus]|uniref:DUF881 domain-containing protein n=1 Tax=Actinoplanes aureus TaxID=2792083 RepID=UPI001E4EC6C1|nr:DUF881 domain-containing protein [Actinoplanes aureus]